MILKKLQKVEIIIIIKDFSWLFCVACMTTTEQKRKSLQWSCNNKRVKVKFLWKNCFFSSRLILHHLRFSSKMNLRVSKKSNPFSAHRALLFRRRCWRAHDHDEIERRASSDSKKTRQVREKAFFFSLMTGAYSFCVCFFFGKRKKKRIKFYK